MPSAAGATAIIFLTDPATGRSTGTHKLFVLRQRQLPGASGAVAASICTLLGLRTTMRDPDRRRRKPSRLTPMDMAEIYGMFRSPGMDECEAETKPGRSRRTAAPEPVETTPVGIDAFPRIGAAGPGCQAATVADGRRETKIDAPRWRKCASWMQGGPTNGIRKPATVRVAGWRPDEGREGGNLCNIHHIFTASRHTNAVLYYKTFNPMSSRICSTFILNQAAFTCSV